MKRYLSLLFLLIPFLICNNSDKYSAGKRTEVLVLGSIHGAHKHNPNYSFERLFELIDSFRPDLIGIEIRPEDISMSLDYLQKSYPPDMIRIRERYAKEKKVIGFDWLAEDIESKPIPDNYWNEISAIKKLEREFGQDSSTLAQNIKNGILAYDMQQRDIINHGTLLDLNTKYDSVTYMLYDKFKALTRGSKYEEMSDFYTRRDEHIGRNIIETIRQNRGKRIIFVMGVDHRGFAVTAIRKEFRKKVEIVDLKNLIAKASQ